MAEPDSIESILDQENIDLEKLKDHTFNGCPDNGSLRARCWRLLLGALPLKRSSWNEVLKVQRENYNAFVTDFVIKCEQKKNQANSDPLSNMGDEWNEFFADNEVLSQIDKDARRLYPDLGFFSLPTRNPATRAISSDYKLGCLRDRIQRANLDTFSSVKQRNGAKVMEQKRSSMNDEDDYCKLNPGEEANWEVVERLLFIYAKLNQGTKYIQGMNEIIGPIYYVLSSDPDPEWSKYAEHDTFYCFTRVMSEIRDNFIQSMDESTSGIHANMSKVYILLKQHDYSVWQTLQEQEIRPQFFLFRWMTLLLSQEMRIPDTIRLWDTLFSDKMRFDLLNYICVAILTLIREELIAGDFGHNMRLLQNTGEVLPDVQSLIGRAHELREIDIKKSSKSSLGKRLKISLGTAKASVSRSIDQMPRINTGHVKRRLASLRSSSKD